MPVRHPADLLGDEGLDEVLKRLPPRLYKYSGLSGARLAWIKSLVADSILHFPRPSSFNDPLDCRVPPRYEASALIIEQFWRRVVRQNFPGESIRNHKRTIRRLILESKTPGGQARLNERFFESLDVNGTACFAKDPASMLMWSSYAEGHSGVAVRFNMGLKHLARIPRQWLPVEVQYRSTFPDINYYRSTTTDFIMTVLGTKSRAWAHEEEWRLVLVGHSGNVSMPPGMIDGVVFGIRINPSLEAMVRSWINDRVPNVELLRVVHKPNSFELEVIPA